jgi:hypothetical protein
MQKDKSKLKIIYSKIFFVLIIFFGLFGLAKSSLAATYYIDYSGGLDTNNGTSTSTPFKHCPGDSAAVSNAASTTFVAGDKIIFKGGVTYTTPSGSQINLSWGGSGDTDANRIIYDGDSGTYAARWGSGTSKAIIDGNHAAAAIFLANSNKSYVTINNFELRSIRSDYESNIIDADQITSANYFKITNNTIHDAGSGADINTAIGRCISSSSSHWLIEGNSFYDCYHAGIYLNNGPSNTTVMNNTFGDKTSWGLALAEGGNDDLDGNTIYNNTFYNIGSYYDQGSPHCNDIIIWVQGDNGESASGSLTNTSIYNNYFYESSPTTGTGVITLQINTTDQQSSTENATNFYVYNNITANEGRNAFCNLSASQGNINNIYIYTTIPVGQPALPQTQPANSLSI